MLSRTPTDPAELAISAAQDAARNKYATAHANAAHARLIEAAVKNPPVAFSMFPTPDNFEDAREYLSALASAFDDVAANVASEASSNATIHVSYRDRVAIFTNALIDSGLLGDLNAAAEGLREDAMEDA